MDLDNEAAHQLQQLVDHFEKELVQEAQAFAEMKDKDEVGRNEVLNALGSRRRQVVEEESEVNTSE